MDTRGLIKSTPLKEALTIIGRFFSKSKLYDFANYLYMRGDGTSIELVSPLVLGEAISSGLIRMSVPYEGDAFEQIAIPNEDITGLARLIEGEDIHFELKTEKNSYMELAFTKSKVKLTLAEAEIPPIFYITLDKLKEEELTNFPLEEINDVTNVLNKELKGQVVSYSYQGIYITKDWSFVTNGLQMVGHLDTIELPTDIYLPKFAVQVLKSLPKGKYGYTQKVVGFDETVSPHLYIEGEGIEIYMQEWASKDVYPIEPMKQMTQLEGTPIPMEDIKNIIKWVLHKEAIVEIDFKNGVAYSQDRKYEVEIEKQDLPVLAYSKTVLPDVKSLEAFQMVEILDSGMIKFGGFLLTHLGTNIILESAGYSV